MRYNYSALNRLVSKIVILFKDIFLKPITVNACLHYSWGRLVHRNWGDDINIYLLKRLFQRSISPLFFSSISMRKRKNDYLIIGSTITMQTTNKSIIWGAGVIDDNEKLPAKPQKVLAVRGPLSRQYLMAQGVKCPEIFGDPAMLVKYIYQPRKRKKTYKLGLIPHYEDIGHPAIKNFTESEDVLIICTEGYKTWLSFIDNICSCEFISSSSLHGLIIAETYNIPNLWIEISGKLIGGHFKFHDFFLSIGNDRTAPYVITTDTDVTTILSMKNQYKKGQINLQPLIDSSPFKIHLPLKNHEI